MTSRFYSEEEIELIRRILKNPNERTIGHVQVSIR